MKVKLSDLVKGQTFIWKGLEWKVLSVMKGGTGCFVEATKSVTQKAFDEGNCNDWRTSSLRAWLNGEFLESLDAEGDIIPTERDLTTDDGLKDYGMCTDMVTMLTTDEYRKTRDLHPAPDCWRWLITADGTEKSSGTYFVRCVCSDGSLSNGNAYSGGRGVLPALTLKSSILVSVPGDDLEEDAETEGDLSPEQYEMALYEGAVKKFGEKAQILMAVEEMSELTKALLKYIRFKDFGHGNEGEVMAAISEERADVEIMLNQLHVIFGDNSEADCLALENLAELVGEDE